MQFRRGLYEEEIQNFVDGGGESNKGFLLMISLWEEVDLLHRLGVDTFTGSVLERFADK